jgi:hypothetical protein
VLGPLAGHDVEVLVLRHVRGEGAAALVVDGALGEGDERLLAGQVLRSLAVAADNIRLFETERSIALALQHALLPDRSPEVAGLRLATRYLASEQHADIGGDFYEAFAIDADRVLLAIGDVCGHSLQAAAIMGELRAALRAYALEGLDPAAIVRRLDALLQRFWPTMIASLCVSVLEPATGLLSVVSAGHIPILVADGAGAWWLTGGVTMLGVHDQHPVATTVQLPPGCTLVFVTDGLIERRTRTLDAGFAQLAAAVTERVPGDLEALCDHLLAACRPPTGGWTDDVAVMVAALEARDERDGRAEPAGRAPRSLGPGPVLVEPAY